MNKEKPNSGLAIKNMEFQHMPQVLLDEKQMQCFT